MRGVVLGLGVAGAALLAGSALPRVAAQADPGLPAFYTESVKPIFVSNCGRCHMGPAHQGGLSLSTKAGILKGGRDGVVLVPGDPASSLLVRLIRHEGPKEEPGPMPPHEKISDADIATIERWVRAGAAMPDDSPQ